MSIRDQILASTAALKSETVTFPDIINPETDAPLSLVVREMNVAERNRFLLTFAETVEVAGGFERRPVEDALRQARLVATCAHDTDGARVFTDDDVEKIGELPASVVDRLFEAAARLSGVQADSPEVPDEAGKTRSRRRMVPLRTS